jgi:hypothetical protein
LKLLPDLILFTTVLLFNIEVIWVLGLCFSFFDATKARDEKAGHNVKSPVLNSCEACVSDLKDE